MREEVDIIDWCLSVASFCRAGTLFFKTSSSIQAADDRADKCMWRIDCTTIMIAGYAKD